MPASANIATITMGEHGQQQVFVITDPAQLEALQVRGQVMTPKRGHLGCIYNQSVCVVLIYEERQEKCNEYHHYGIIHVIVHRGSMLVNFFGHPYPSICIHITMNCLECVMNQITYTGNNVFTKQ